MEKCSMINCDKDGFEFFNMRGRVCLKSTKYSESDITEIETKVTLCEEHFNRLMEPLKISMGFISRVQK